MNWRRSDLGNFCRWRHFLPLFVLLTAGCDSGPTDPPPALEVTVLGRLERGAVVDLELRLNGVALPQAEVTWAVQPAGAAELSGTGSAILKSAGIVTFTGTQGDRTASLQVTTALPPRIVFDREVGGNRDIWSAFLDGEGATRLTTHSTEDSDPSAAAGRVVFVAFRNGHADLYTVPLEGGTERRLTTTNRNEVAPSLARDGRRVVYASDASGVTRLWTLDIETLAASALTLQGSATSDIHTSPAWRPHSDTIVYMSTALGSADIHLARAGSGVTQPIVQGSKADVEPSISPDGSRVVFVSNRDGNDELYLLTLATGALVRLTNRPASDAHPAWLDDGRIVFTSTTGGTSSLYWLDPVNPEEIHLIPGTDGAGHPSGV